MIDFDLPKGSRIVVAMSGGVDSSVVAALAAEAGYDAIGVTLQLYDQGSQAARPGACCAGADIRDAARVAEAVGIPHYVLDYESAFRREVMEDFADAYAAGRTPIPCVRCNQTVKFRDLMAVAKDLGAEALATGHYVRRVQGELHRAADTGRDQSYFLFATTREQLDYLRFPLGDLPKAEVRAHAERLGLAVAAKPDSQDICFVPDRDYAAVVRKLRPDAGEPGDIVDLSGRVLGKHAGLLHYTVGQRRGLDLGGRQDPLYVVRLDATRRRVVVGPATALGVETAFIRDLNWLAEPIATSGRPVHVKVRSAATPVSARLFADGAVRFETPERGVAPGQACVAYAGDRVLGGGWIERTERVVAEVAA